MLPPLDEGLSLAFSIVIVGFALLIVVLLGFSSRIVARTISAILNAAKLKKMGAHISIGLSPSGTSPNSRFALGAFSIGVLSGRLILNDVTLSTKSFSVRAVQLLCVYRWWKRSIREKKEQEGQLRVVERRGFITVLDSGKTCRLTIFVTGLELTLYNNVNRHRALETVIQGLPFHFSPFQFKYCTSIFRNCNSRPTA